MGDEWVCPNCGQSEHSVPVWEDPEQFKMASPPQYIGCTACNEMEELR